MIEGDDMYSVAESEARRKYESVVKYHDNPFVEKVWDNLPHEQRSVLVEKELSRLRRGGREAEGNGLLNRRTP